MKALYGVTYCKIKENTRESIENAKEQLEFFNAIGETMEKSHELLFLQGLISKYNNESFTEVFDECF